MLRTGAACVQVPEVPDRAAQLAHARVRQPVLDAEPAAIGGTPAQKHAIVYQGRAHSRAVREYVNRPPPPVCAIPTQVNGHT
jgi:hypothetical protein